MTGPEAPRVPITQDKGSDIHLPAFLRPESDQEMTLISGLGLISAGFILAQVIGSILFVPLSLLVPGAVLTLTAVIARPESPQ